MPIRYALSNSFGFGGTNAALLFKKYEECIDATRHDARGLGLHGPYRRRAESRSAMKIAVCIKQVPTREWQPRLNDDKTWIREQDASFEMNEPDAYALEEALRLREKHGGEVVVCSAGPARVQQVIREALARGADRALHVEDDALGAGRRVVTAEALAAAMARRDSSTSCSPACSPTIRATRRWAWSSPSGSASRTRPSSWKCRSTDGRGCRVKRELEGGWFQWIAMPLPALLTIQSGINQLRYATLKGIMAAKKKEIRKVALPAGLAAAQEIVALSLPTRSQADADDRRLAG